MTYTVGQMVKDWRGRDFCIKQIVPAPPICGRMMQQRGWEPIELVIEYKGRVRMGFVRISDGTIHEALRFDGAESGGGGNNATRT
jgi:hypothetical protein